MKPRGKLRGRPCSMPLCEGLSDRKVGQAPFCGEHAQAWLESSERRRFDAMPAKDRRGPRGWGCVQDHVNNMMAYARNLKRDGPQTQLSRPENRGEVIVAYDGATPAAHELVVAAPHKNGVAKLVVQLDSDDEPAAT